MNAMSKATQAATIDDLRMHFFVPGRAETRIQGQISEQPSEKPQTHQEPEKEILSDQDFLQLLTLVLAKRRKKEELNKERRKSWDRLGITCLVVVGAVILFEIASITGIAPSSFLLPVTAIGIAASMGGNYAFWRGDRA